MTTIGITGGIGSGKSMVSALLRVYGVPVYDADHESKRLLVTSPPIRRPSSSPMSTGRLATGPTWFTSMRTGSSRSTKSTPST